MEKKITEEVQIEEKNNDVKPKTLEQCPKLGIYLRWVINTIFYKVVYNVLYWNSCHEMWHFFFHVWKLSNEINFSTKRRQFVFHPS